MLKLDNNKSFKGFPSYDCITVTGVPLFGPPDNAIDFFYVHL